MRIDLEFSTYQELFDDKASSIYLFYHSTLKLFLSSHYLIDLIMGTAEESIPFSTQISLADGKSLELLGHGITDIEIHFLQIKFTAIGVYLEKDQVVKYLDAWKGKTKEELARDELFYEAIIACPLEKVLKVVVIKEIKGSQYGVQLENGVRDRLAEVDKYEEEEEEELEKVTGFFQSKYFKKDSVLTFSFHGASQCVEIEFTTEGKKESKIKIENHNVVEMIQKWYLGGERATSPTTINSLTETLAGILCS